MEIKQEIFSHFQKQPVTLFTLSNDHGVEARLMDYGATLVKFIAPDKHNRRKNIVLGFETFDEYIQPANDAYFGATIGRNAGRIARGQFELDGIVYQTTKNNNGNTLHGGENAFNCTLWQAETAETEDAVSVIFSAVFPDGENGFPGTLSVSVTYTLTNDNSLHIDYHATTDKATIFLPTNHTYFNLHGDMQTSVADHVLQLACDSIAAIDDLCLPTGELLPVDGTPFDFRKADTLAKAFALDHPQTELVGGFDHPFVFSQTDNQATLSEAESGYTLTMITTEPAVVIYTCNGMADKFMLNGAPAVDHAGVTLETQIIPDAINHDNFGNCILRPEEVYESRTTFTITAD